MSSKYYVETWNNSKIYYTLTKTKRKTIGIIIDKNGEVRVHAPFSVSVRQVSQVVQKKAGWIIKKVNEIKARNSDLIPRQFVNGEKLLYLGREYFLEIIERNSDKAEVLVQDNIIKVYISRDLLEENREQSIKEALIKWYRQRFAEIIKERFEKYSLQLKVAPRKVVIKNQKTRWGSCSKKGNININWRLVMAPLYIIDYVIVHELCHLKIMNHSKDFWDLVASVLPNCHESRDWLRANENRLVI